MGIGMVIHLISEQVMASHSCMSIQHRDEFHLSNQSLARDHQRKLLKAFHSGVHHPSFMEVMGTLGYPWSNKNGNGKLKS